MRHIAYHTGIGWGLNEVPNAVNYHHDMNNTTIELEKNFFTGGNATFTVESPKGIHYTFKVRQPKKQNPQFTGPAPHFVSLLNGPDNQNSYVYLGMMDSRTGMVKLTKASRMNDESTPVKVARWALKHAFGDRTLPEGYAIHHEGKCGCCGRPLTVPESIKRGIGPECWSKMGGV